MTAARDILRPPKNGSCSPSAESLIAASDWSQKAKLSRSCASKASLLSVPAIFVRCGAFAPPIVPHK